jgi:hypothetical protein
LSLGDGFVGEFVFLLGVLLTYGGEHLLHLS